VKIIKHQNIRNGFKAISLSTPFRRIDLLASFGTPINFRTETLTFEVVEFQGTYHAILG
jgi:hypothetical protein